MEPPRRNKKEGKKNKNPLTPKVLKEPTRFFSFFDKLL
jgi:hypothetical protein